MPKRHCLREQLAGSTVNLKPEPGSGRQPIKATGAPTAANLRRGTSGSGSKAAARS